MEMGWGNTELAEVLDVEAERLAGAELAEDAGGVERDACGLGDQGL